MERLNHELTETLRELVKMDDRGEDVADYIFEVMYGDLGLARDYQNLLDLAKLGYVIVKVDGVETVTEGLTSKGRSYFKDLKEHESRMWKRIWSDRRFQIALSLFTLVLSTVAGYIAGHI